jgi:hypothetical protein
MKLIDLVQWAGLCLALFFAHHAACLTRHQTPMLVRFLIIMPLSAPALILAISIKWQTSLWVYNLTGILVGQVSYIPSWSEAAAAWAAAGTNYLVLTLLRRIQVLLDKHDGRQP